MKRVLIESPFGRNPDGSKCTTEQYARNGTYVLRAMVDSLERGEAPFASHAFYPLVLDDTSQEERRMGMEAGFAWGSQAELVVVYEDYGTTTGMHEGIVRWLKMGAEVTYRKIGENPETPKATPADVPTNFYTGWCIAGSARILPTDSSGGHPDPNKFVENPPKQLPPPGALHIEVEDQEIARSSNADIAFYLRLKATPGCTGKNDRLKSVMHLYIEPHSEAAKLFVARMMAKCRGLPPGSAREQIRQLGGVVQDPTTVVVPAR